MTSINAPNISRKDGAFEDCSCGGDPVSDKPAHPQLAWRIEIARHSQSVVGAIMPSAAGRIGAILSGLTSGCGHVNGSCNLVFCRAFGTTFVGLQSLLPGTSPGKSAVKKLILTARFDFHREIASRRAARSKSA